MWKKGDYVVYGEKGICEVDGTTHLNIPGADSGKLYYVLIPVGEKETKIYSPVDNEKVPLRRPMNHQEAMELIEEIPELSELSVPQEKFRELTVRPAASGKRYLRIGKRRHIMTVCMRNIADGTVRLSLNHNFRLFSNLERGIMI